MAIHELRLSTEDLEKDESPEVLIEFFEDGELNYAVSVSSSGRDGVLDTVSGEADVDAVLGHSPADDDVLIDLATAFTKIRM